ncbi:homoserine kinase [Methanothermococcus sp. SCGC AD-155-K20]|nr:homoserine kinase [Methanothermococcus sp. SCGC AD-155-K20]
MNRVKVLSPATSANLGPGYDVFGLALCEPYDIITLSKSNDKGITLSLKGKCDKIPIEVDKNTAGVVVKKIMEDFNIDEGIHIDIEKGIKPGSGLGSSSASCAGVALAMNELFNLNLSKLELTEYASLGETVAAGVAHADNVAPAIYGGLTMVINYEPLEVLHIPAEFEVVVALPNIQISTREAREILPNNVPISDMVNNIGKACGMIYGIYNRNMELFGKCMMGDAVVEPLRSQLIRDYSKVKNRVMDLDLVHGITISGSGPAIISLPKENCAKSIKEIFLEIWDCPVYHTKVGKGAHVLERD